MMESELKYDKMGDDNLTSTSSTNLIVR